MTLPLNIFPLLPSAQQPLVRTIKTPKGDQHFIHEAWHGFFSQLTTALQNNFSNEGVTVPNQTTANIGALTTKNFALLGDNETNQLKVILNGVVKTITTS